MLYDKIPDAPRPEFSVPPPHKSNKDSHAGDGVIGTTNTKLRKATSKTARKISDQNANEQLLASEVSVMSSNKGKHLKQPGGKKKNKGRKNKQDESYPENLCKPFWAKETPCGLSYMR